SKDGRTHAELWVDFAEGLGAKRGDVEPENSYPEMKALVQHFFNVAGNGSTTEALASFYAYESQVPRIAAEKERGLVEYYGADERTRYYFTLHKAYDVHHARTWKEEITHQLAMHPQQQEDALRAVEGASKALWNALDGIEAVRLANRASTLSGAR